MDQENHLCVQCGKTATAHIIWSDTYDKWFCDPHAPNIWQLLKKNDLTKEQLEFQRWLAKELNREK